MDFSTALAVPVAVRINGKDYNLPRFLMPDMKEWVAEDRKRILDEATAHLNDDDKARFKTYFQPPRSNVFAVIDWARSPEGAPVVIEKQLKKAGVPNDVRAAMLANCDPQDLANLAVELTSAKQAADEAVGNSPDPLSRPASTPGDAPGTGPNNSRNSTQATAA